MRGARAFAWLLLVVALPGCGEGQDAPEQATARTVPVVIEGAGGRHVFHAELAQTAAEQKRGLMYRTALAPDFAMLFAPYPPEGGPPRLASFWMRNTPSALDIIFIRQDGTIARIVENAIPYSDAPILSGDLVAAVLEVPGGRTAELGIAEGDRVRWAPLPKAAVAGDASAR